jgi:hypothetical protein
MPNWQPPPYLVASVSCSRSRRQPRQRWRRREPRRTCAEEELKAAIAEAGPAACRGTRRRKQTQKRGARRQNRIRPSPHLPSISLESKLLWRGRQGAARGVAKAVEVPCTLVFCTVVCCVSIVKMKYGTLTFQDPLSCVAHLEAEKRAWNSVERLSKPAQPGEALRNAQVRRPAEV